MIRRKDKKAAEMTIGTIVVIILALVVLIFLIFGFSSGWNNIWQKILNFGGGGSNADSISQGCQAACATMNGYSYCGQIRTLTFEDKSKYVGSCNTLTNVPNSGIAACSIDCSSYTLKKCGDIGAWKSTCLNTDEDKTSDIQDSEKVDISKTKCCVAKAA